MRKKELLKFKDNLIFSIPEWLYADWKNQYGEKNTIKLLKIFQDEPCIDLRVKSKIDYWVKVLGGIKFSDLTVRLFYKGKVESIKGYKEGSWWVQDIAAQLPVILMGKIKNKKILDLCAAPGGKTLQMLNKGAFVRAIDISKERTEKLKKNIKRTNTYKNLEIKCVDLRTLKEEEIYDVVLLDAPCSGTGTFRKIPDVVWLKNKSDVIKNSKNQKQLLLKALSFVKKGGILIYSNCSLQYEEGEHLINELMNKNIIKIDKINEKEISDYPREIINKGLIRTLPYMYNGGMDGFFIARIKK